MDGNMDEVFALVEERRWFLYGHLSDVDAVAKVRSLPETSDVVVGAVLCLWGEKVPDYGIITMDEPAKGLFPVTVVYEYGMLCTWNAMLTAAGYDVIAVPKEFSNV